ASAVLAASAATVAALRQLDVHRVALVTPPWFDAELTALGRRYFEKAGHDVVNAAPATLESDQRAITRSGLFEWICEHTPDATDGGGVAGTGPPAVGPIDAVERALSRPVVTANQALFWAALLAAKADVTAVSGYGRLFRATSESSALVGTVHA